MNARASQASGRGTGLPGWGQGGRLLTALLTSQRWMHRRVESLRFDADGGTRLRVSLDVTVPDGLPEDQDGGLLLPLAQLRKEALRNFDAVGPEGLPLPILGAVENALQTEELLVVLAGLAFPRADVSSARFQDIMQGVARCRPERGRVWFALGRYKAWKELQVVPRATPELQLFEAVLAQFAENYLMLGHLSPDLTGRRVVIKYSYEEERPTALRSRLPTEFTYESAQFGVARSWHFEVHAPPELGVRRLDVDESTDPSAEPRSDPRCHPRGEPVQVAHVAARPSNRFSEALVVFSLIPLSRGLATTSLVSAWFVALLWGAYVLERAGVTDLVTRTSPESPAVSILLAGPALLLSWLTRAPQHALSAKMIYRLRLPVLVTVLSLLGGALALALPLERGMADTAWGVLLAVQAVAAALSLHNLRCVRGRG